jgi:hypothetical protein
MSHQQLHDLRQGIRHGIYTAKPQAPGQEGLRAHKEEAARLHARFRDDLLAAVDLAGKPGAAHLFDLAWERGHSAGLMEVVTEMVSLAEALQHLGGSVPSQLETKVHALLAQGIVVAFELHEGPPSERILCTLFIEPAAQGEDSPAAVGPGPSLEAALDAAAAQLPAAEAAHV